MQKTLRGRWNGLRIEEPHLIRTAPDGAKITQIRYVDLLKWLAPFENHRVKITVETL